MATTPQKEYPAEKIRNIALIGHGGSGKTTFTEAMLFTAGATTRFGAVDDGSSLSDYHPDEIERKISINLSLLHGDWKGTKFNILDTPGYSDFTGEVISSLRVADIAVVFLKAVEGTEVGTEIVWGYTRQYGTPTVMVVNKLDNENADFDHAVASAKDRFGSDVTIVQFPAKEKTTGPLGSSGSRSSGTGCSPGAGSARGAGSSAMGKGAVRRLATSQVVAARSARLAFWLPSSRTIWSRLSVERAASWAAWRLTLAA